MVLGSRDAQKQGTVCTPQDHTVLALSGVQAPTMYPSFPGGLVCWVCTLLSGILSLVVQGLCDMTCVSNPQIALIDLLTSVGLKPDGIIGHSLGEVACGYADGCLSQSEAVLAAYWRGQCIKEARLPPGSMAAVGRYPPRTPTSLGTRIFLKGASVLDPSKQSAALLVGEVG